jgi:hypothetical protein
MVTVKPRWSRNFRADLASLGRAEQLTSSRSKVFIALDLEWDKNDSTNILEIGLAVLDLREGKLHPNRFPPSTWSIRPRHIIIAENRAVHNGPSNKVRFQFGRTYITRVTNAVQVVQALFDQYGDDEIVIVQHRMTDDLKRLEELGIKLPQDVEVFDIAGLERAYMNRHDGLTISLARICEELNVPYYSRKKLRNAGNDAFFVMASFSGMCCLPGDA